jgi:RecB family exonuclease
MKLLRHQRQLEERAEGKRLLYVAATRARDHLFLVGTLRDKIRAGGAWADLLSDHESPHLGAREATELLCLEPPAPPSPEVLAPSPASSAMLATLATTVDVEVTPSSLDRFESCPARWYRTDVLGLRERSRSERLDIALAAARGEVLHSVLEDGSDEETAFRRWQAAAFTAGADADDVARLWPSVLVHLNNAATDPLVQARLRAPGWPEAAFRVRHGEVVLRGQIDRLWRDTSGWVVLDWKSERVRADTATMASRHHHQLLAYSWAASRILEASGQPTVVRAEVYFTDKGVLEALPSWTQADFEAFEGTLGEVARIASSSWIEVERRAISGPARPCTSCVFRNRGCTGQHDELATVPAAPDPGFWDGPPTEPPSWFSEVEQPESPSWLTSPRPSTRAPLPPKKKKKKTRRRKSKPAPKQLGFGFGDET